MFYLVCVCVCVWGGGGGGERRLKNALSKLFMDTSSRGKLLVVARLLFCFYRGALLFSY